MEKKYVKPAVRTIAAKNGRLLADSFKADGTIDGPVGAPKNIIDENSVW